MANDDDGYVPRFRLASLLFSTRRRVAARWSYLLGRKIRRSFESRVDAANKRRAYEILFLGI